MTEEFPFEPSQFDAPSEEPAEAVPPSAAVPEAVPEMAEALVSSDSAPPAVDASTPIRIAVSALSDMGCVRTNNEDSFGYDESLGIYVVCDGMGGMASGEVASSRAVAAIVNSFAETAALGGPVSSRLLVAINAANSDVWENGQVPENKGMGTTAVVAALDGDKLVLGNVGDSRAYLIQNGQCVQLTVDHSYVNELIRNGTLTIETAQHADLRGMESIITRAVGVAADVQPDFFSVDLKSGTAVLLATDGLTRYLGPDEIAAILSGSAFESACGNMIDLAKQRGGHDNVTCILLLAMAA